MEEPQSWPAERDERSQKTEGDDRSAKTAEKLRTLRAQADETLAGHRRRVSHIEAELNLRLQQIAEELARDRVAEEMEAASSAELQVELEGLQASLTDTDAEIESLQAQLATQASEHQTQLDERDEELGQLIEQAEQAQGDRDELAAQLQEQRDACTRLSQELEAALQSLEELRVQECEACSTLQEELATLRQLFEEQQAATVQAQEELTSSRQTEDEIRAAESAVHEELAALQQQHDEAQAECARLQEELTAAQQAEEGARCVESSAQEELAAVQQQLEQQQAECSQLGEELATTRQAEESERDTESQQEVDNLKERCQQLENKQAETEQALEEAESKNEAAAQLLQTAEQRILELDNHEQHEQELGQVNKKFELALADVHKLKRENAELHAELASRPAASDEESPELVSLRSERDALATKVSELESAPAQAVDADMQQEVADLQRRFELAVDDVRQLKQINAQLQEKVAAQPADSEPLAIAGSDWQAQKARLLAELDAEDQSSLTNERRAARATIEGTITITDQVVAEKDKEIAELEASLETRPAEEEMEKMKQALQEEIFGNDELIQAERERLEEIQQEWQEKLRKAELEISVERAKLARNQSALEEKLAQMPAVDLAEDSTEDDGKPRRRWLSALGLREDEE